MSGYDQTGLDVVQPIVVAYGEMVKHLVELTAALTSIKENQNREKVDIDKIADCLVSIQTIQKQQHPIIVAAIAAVKDVSQSDTRLSTTEIKSYIDKFLVIISVVITLITTGIGVFIHFQLDSLVNQVLEAIPK